RLTCRHGRVARLPNAAVDATTRLTVRAPNAIRIVRISAMTGSPADPTVAAAFVGTDQVGRPKVRTQRGEIRMRTWILGGLIVVASTGISLAQDASAGNAAFSKWCLPCHAAGEGATIKLGPPLNGIDGRKSAAFDGFNYSDALKGLNITWNEAQFKEFVN